MIYYKGTPIGELSKEDKADYDNLSPLSHHRDYLGAPHLFKGGKKQVIQLRHIVLFCELAITFVATQDLVYCLYIIAGYTAYRFSNNT